MVKAQGDDRRRYTVMAGSPGRDKVAHGKDGNRKVAIKILEEKFGKLHSGEQVSNSRCWHEHHCYFGHPLSACGSANNGY